MQDTVKTKLQQKPMHPPDKINVITIILFGHAEETRSVSRFPLANTAAIHVAPL